MLRIDKTCSDNAKSQGSAENQATCQAIKAIAKINRERGHASYQPGQQHQKDQPGERYYVEQRPRYICIGRIRFSTTSGIKPPVEEGSCHRDKKHPAKFCVL